MNFPTNWILHCITKFNWILFYHFLLWNGEPVFHKNACGTSKSKAWLTDGHIDWRGALLLLAPQKWEEKQTYTFFLHNVRRYNPEEMYKFHERQRREEPEWLPLVAVLALDDHLGWHVDIGHGLGCHGDLVQHSGWVPGDGDLQNHCEIY